MTKQQSTARAIKAILGDCPSPTKRIVRLVCESPLKSYDQTIHDVLVEREDNQSWYGKPTANNACPSLQWPKFAWRDYDAR